MDSQWTTFTKRIPVNADAKQLHSAWATSAGLESWFLKRAAFIDANNNIRASEGDSYEWSWHGYPGGAMEKGKILEATPDLFQFTFIGCVVSFSVKHEAGENVVEITQENIPIDENAKSNLFVACGEGWTFYLANLKSITEGGIDLRNKNEEIKKVVSS